MLDQAQLEEKARFKREKSREAIALALEGSWEQAVRVNEEILRVFPDDVDALNRLGKALMELGRYPEARDSFAEATRVAPYNTISKKNLERLAHLEESPAVPKAGKVATPFHFIEESGKSEITPLFKPAPREVLAKMAAGDQVTLSPRDNIMAVENSLGECLGQLEPRLGLRLLHLAGKGNRYDAAVTSVRDQEISIIVHETYRHPDVATVASFSGRTRDGQRLYWREALASYDVGTELDEEEHTSAWREGYSEVVALSEGEEPAESAFNAKTAEADQEFDEE